jgi:hypothetical protein
LLYDAPPVRLIYQPHPITMHRVGRDGLETIVPDSTLGSGDVLLVVFGEIDCRCHVQVQLDRGCGEEEVLRDLNDRYVRSILSYQRRKNLRCIVVRGVVPPLHDGQHQHRDANYPIRGSFRDRLRWQRSLNALLEESCAKHDGLVYLPPPIWAENEDGSLNRDKSDGIIHVNPTPENKRAAVEAALAVAN